ncbi:netrin receptor UNC5B-a-like isoform X2 [Mya arenaria]|nr:netrin receptor UNC5B-a-like isoform X2 [Mya arenaria]
MSSTKQFIFIALTVCTGKLRGEQIQKSVGDAIRFVLPPYFECGPYSLIGPNRVNVINISNATQCDVMQLYVDRGKCQLQTDWSFWFALHKLSKRDGGRYVLRGGPNADSVGCKLEQWTDVIVLGSEWLLWGSWSGCSQSCGREFRTRSRDCSQPLTCGVDNQEIEVCEYQPCKDHIERITSTLGRMTTDGHWSYWSTWSHCSRTCAEGQKTRSRDCLDERSNTLPTEYCKGDKHETDICKETDCLGARNNQVTSSSGDMTLSVPLYGVVGAGAGIFIIVLVVVIVALMMKLKRRRRLSIGSSSTAMDRHAQKKMKKCNKRKQSPAISIHLYDDINDDDVKSDMSESKGGDRSSVMTMDNPYVFLPKSPNPQIREYGNVAYSNTSNTVAMFNNGTSTENNGHQSENSDILTETTDFFPENVEGPQTSWYNERHKSVDSVGYTISANERARRKRYLK